MKKRYVVIPAALSILIGICAFSGKGKQVPADEKIELVMRAKNFVRRLNRREYENCHEMFGETMAESNPVEKLRETFDPIVDSLGDFLCFRSASVTRKNYDGSLYTLCTLRCSYDKGSAVFTVLFNEENKIDGVYVR